MSFIDSIPEYHKTMVEALKPVDTKIGEIAFKLDAHYEAEEKADHECDCQYCPYGDVSTKDLLSDDEIAELEEKRISLKGERDDHVLAIKRLESYAAFVKKPLPKEVLIK